MGANYKPVKGDRVRVVLEGEVTDDDTSLGFTVEHEVPFFYDDPGLVSIEKLEPPVEVFKPGDVVRSKAFPSYLYLINDKGYSYVGGNGSYRPISHTFTSESFEKVNLSS